MPILVELKGNSVVNVTAPGWSAKYAQILESYGFTFREEPDGTPVAPGWEYDPDNEAYFDPRAE